MSAHSPVDWFLLLNWYLIVFSVHSNFLQHGENNKKTVTKEKLEVCGAMHHNGDAPSRISASIDIPLRTVQGFIARSWDHDRGVWREWKEKRGKMKSNKYEERVAAVQQILALDSTLTLAQINDKLPDDPRTCRKSLSGALKELDYTRKRVRIVPVERNSLTTIDLRKRYADAIRRKQDSTLSFLDETDFNLHTGPRNGYAPRGETSIAGVPGNKQSNISVLACIGLNGLIHWSMLVSAYNAVNFGAFIEELDALLPPNCTLIVGNARIHHTSDVKEIFVRHEINVKYLPAFSPQLNHIEQFWSQIKSKQKSIPPRPRTKDTLLDSITESFSALLNTDMSGYQREMR